MEIAITTLRVHCSLNHRTRKSCSRLPPGKRWNKSSRARDLHLTLTLTSPCTRDHALTSQILRCQFLASRLTTWFTAFRGQLTHNRKRGQTVPVSAQQESASTLHQMRIRRPSWVTPSSPTSSPRSTSTILLWHLRRALFRTGLDQ